MFVCATVSLSFIPSLVFFSFIFYLLLFVIFTALLLLLGVPHILFLSFFHFSSFSLFKLTSLYFLHHNIYLPFLQSLPYVFIYFSFSFHGEFPYLQPYSCFFKQQSLVIFVTVKTLHKTNIFSNCFFY